MAWFYDLNVSMMTSGSQAALISTLIARCEEQAATIVALKAEVQALKAEVQVLKAQLAQNSSNSSKPPSSDPPSNPAPKKTNKGKIKRRRGGQPGRLAARRELLCADKVENLFPQRCAGCGNKLVGDDPHPRRVQLIEIPAIKPVVTDYLCHKLKCGACGEKTASDLPVQARGGVFGPRLSALVCLFSGKYRMTKRLTQEVLSDVLGVNLALGSVCNIERRLCAALEEPVEQAKEFVQQQPVVHADETSWRENKAKAWLWIVACPLVAVFCVASRRGAEVAKQLLGCLYRGVAVTDRWGGYGWLSLSNRQICWAHLIRDFQSWVDSGGVGKGLGEALLRQIRKMFHWWHQVRNGQLGRPQFEQRMRAVQLNIATLLTQASECGDKRVEGMAKKIIGVETALWTFISNPDVEPTNNFGECIIRKAVIWRKVCFGTDSQQGSRYAERIMTTVTTLKLQKRSVLEYLTQAYLSALAHKPAPTLLPFIDGTAVTEQRMAA